MTFPQTPPAAALDSHLSATDFQTPAVAHPPRSTAPGLAQAGGQVSPTLSMSADAGAAHAEDRVLPEPVPASGAVPRESRFARFLKGCCLATPTLSLTAGTITACMSTPVGCQICGYGLLAGGAIAAGIGGCGAVQGPQHQVMQEVLEDVRPSAAVAYGLAEAHFGLLAVGLSGVAGASGTPLVFAGAVGAAVFSPIAIAKMLC